ncbi:hypothetical protein K488DRAFT_89965 [Vararia minispora EC-137]|uniref:Uncharacterized protein n=1 Tax=Vararia minispora EC-137 TaxID=1314806 RepID=A0ACB8QAC4_9AGAM|nr:hypothetical protein K488DRAFT_89965 [Vararia minispora EC-137]
MSLAPYTRPPSSSSESERLRRDSNALRASVLDAAMLLGVGASRTLRSWIFDDGSAGADADDEDEFAGADDEDESLRVRALSPPLSPSPPLPRRLLTTAQQQPARTPFGRNKSIYREDFDAATLASYIFDRDAALSSPPLSVPARAPVPSVRFATQQSRGKLRKPRFAVEEEEGGYVTEGGGGRDGESTGIRRSAGGPMRGTKKARRTSRAYAVDADADEDGYVSEGAALRKTKKARPTATATATATGGLLRLLGARTRDAHVTHISGPLPLVRARAGGERSGESSDGTETPEPRTPSSGRTSVVRAGKVR